MKFLKFLLLLTVLLIGRSGFAANPGSNYGCLVWGDRLYTHYVNDAYAPGNPYWGPFHYYDDQGTSYKVDYNNGGCGTINPNFTNQGSSSGQTCFSKVGGAYRQGVLYTYNSNALCQLPLDDYMLPLVLLAGAIGGFYVYRGQTHQTFKTL